MVRLVNERTRVVVVVDEATATTLGDDWKQAGVVEAEAPATAKTPARKTTAKGK